MFRVVKASLSVILAASLGPIGCRWVSTMARCSVPFVGVMIACLTVGLWSLECGKANRANAKTIEHDRKGSVITQSLILALTQYVRHDPPAHDPAPSQLDVRTRVRNLPTEQPMTLRVVLQFRSSLPRNPKVLDSTRSSDGRPKSPGLVNPSPTMPRGSAHPPGSCFSRVAGYHCQSYQRFPIRRGIH